METIKNRYEFVLLFDVENGNPNGDPDAGNAPRSDAETGYGIVTDVCLKRKIREYVNVVKEGEPRYNILVNTDKALNDKFVDAHKLIKINNKASKAEKIEIARQYMCDNYFDVRTFGAVMSTGDDSCGAVRGSVQINIARSIDPIFPVDLGIIRKAVTKKSDFENRLNENGMAMSMGKKSIVPYGLYRAEGYISAILAQKTTGFSEDDLSLLWEALVNMFEHDHSAARGKMCVRKLIVFKHESILGNAPSVVLFDKIKVEKKPEVVYPRSYSDYTVTIDEKMPDGVELIVKL